MTTTFSPRKTMLRVDEKIFPVWALFDDELDSSPLLLLYVVIWLGAFLGWNLSQADLARLVKMSLRAAQGNLTRLEQRGYIVARREGTHKYYDLALSPHVLGEFLRQGVEFLATDERADSPAGAPCSARAKTRKSRAASTRNPRVEHAKSAPAFNKIKEIKEINSPLSPLPSGHVVGAVGSSPKRHTARGELSDFEKLWEAWPVKKGRAPAQRLYCRLARLGRLPSANALLTKVADLKARDAHWRNGYVKELGNWLRAEGWNDEPFLRPDKSSFSSTAGAMPPAPAEDSKQKNPDDPILEDKPSAPMRRETVLAIAAKSFCPWSRDEINAMLERADEFYQGQKKGDGESRVPGQQAAHPGTDGARILFHHDLCGTERERAHDNQLRAVLALSVRDEVRSPFFSFGVPFSVSGLACAPRFGPA